MSQTFSAIDVTCRVLDCQAQSGQPCGRRDLWTMTWTPLVEVATGQPMFHQERVLDAGAVSQADEPVSHEKFQAALRTLDNI